MLQIKNLTVKVAEKVIINNLTTFIDLNSAVYRDLIDIQPKEYSMLYNHGKLYNNNNMPASGLSIWNNNALSAVPSSQPLPVARPMANNKLVNTTKKLSRKQQSKVNKRLRQRTFKELNVKYKQTDIITKQSILDIAYRIFTINKYPYLKMIHRHI